MSEITQFTIEDVRCFAGEQTFDIRPLTFIIGENSTGKTTALGCLHTLLNYSSRRFRTRFGHIGAHFDEEPYGMGGFEDIVRNYRSKEKKFKLGFIIDKELRYVTHWGGDSKIFEPVIKSLDIHHPKGCITWTKSEKISDRRFSDLKIEKGTGNEFKVTSYQGAEIDLVYLRRLAYNNNLFHREHEREFDELNNFIQRHKVMNFLADTLLPYSFAPVRARPKRTYDPISENESPEGDDIPMFLMRMKLQNEFRWKYLKKRLEDFGEKSGLFQIIDIRKFGKTIADPFQIQVKVKGKRTNIVDVGYGVSQILPILVRLFHRRDTMRGYNYFLMQQPEVHLHPKAQAEFTSLLAGMASRNRDRFVVETHSDYMIDRIRIEIMNGGIGPNDVALNYLEANASGKVTVHNIHFDEKANLKNVPSGYRKFFSRETDRLIGLIKD